jgi:uncharacterized protein (DUF1501 family)
MIGGLSMAGGALALPIGRAGSLLGDPLEEDGEPPILVLVELAGGNDGLNTLVPYADDAYYAQRPKLQVARDTVLPLSDELGLSPHLSRLRGIFDDGRMAVVRGVGYPNPVYSHFKSFEIWHTAHLDGRAAGDGWIARLRAAAWGRDPRPELVVHVGSDQPYSLHSSKHGVLSFEVPEKYLWVGESEGRRSYRAAGDMTETGNAAANEGRNAVLSRLYRTLRQAQSTSPRILEATDADEPGVEYPAEPFARSLRTIAALIEARMGTRIFSVQLEGFDTHAAQIKRHAELLQTLDAGLSSFLTDLKGRSSSRNVLVAVVSEFGRRVKENHSRGTDHGSAGLSFLLGERVKGGLYGEQPSLTKLDEDGNLVFNTDFRSVYATLVEDWFGVPQREVLWEEHPRLPVLKA